LFGQSLLTKLTGQSEPTEVDFEPNPDDGYFDMPPDDREPPRIVTVEGFDVEISPRGRFVLGTVDGQAMPIPVDEYEAQLVEQLMGAAATSVEFRTRWVSRTAREDLLRELVEGGRSPKVVQLLRSMNDYDLFDVLGQLGYDLAPLTRMMRFATFTQQQASWLKAMPPKSARTVEAIAQQFAFEGTDGLENQQLFRVPSIERAGGMAALKVIGKPLDVLQEMKVRLFSA